MPTILLADDHKLFRKGLCLLISSFPIQYDFCEASNGLEAIGVIDSRSVDLVLLDVQMPKMGGIEVLKEIRKRKLPTKVIILTQFNEDSLILYLLQLGMDGFLQKDCAPEQLQKAIQEVLTTGHYYSKVVAKVIEDSLASENRLANLDISPREFQVLVLLKEGKSNKEIAIDLGLKLNTIESYHKSLIKRTNCKNTADLISLAYRTGILPT